MARKGGGRKSILLNFISAHKKTILQPPSVSQPPLAPVLRRLTYTRALDKCPFKIGEAGGMRRHILRSRHQGNAAS